jgi:hypothetical protein
MLPGVASLKEDGRLFEGGRAKVKPVWEGVSDHLGGEGRWGEGGGLGVEG